MDEAVDKFLADWWSRYGREVFEEMAQKLRALQEEVDRLRETA